MDWHDRYALNPRPFGEEPTPFLRELVEDPARFGVPDRALRILCPGDGYGRNGLWLARRGHQVVGLDLVPSAVRSALSDAIASGVDYLAVPADVSGSPFPLARGTSFDAVVSVWMRLPDAASRRAWNAECVRRLTADGIVVVVAGRRVTDAPTEQAEWPRRVLWQDHSTHEEVRLLGRVRPPGPPTLGSGP